MSHPSLFYYPYRLPKKRCPRCQSYRLREIYNSGRFFCYQCRDCFHWWSPAVVSHGKVTTVSLESIKSPRGEGRGCHTR